MIVFFIIYETIAYYTQFFFKISGSTILYKMIHFYLLLEKIQIF